MSDERVSLKEITARIIDAGAVEVRDVDGGESPFVYSSGNRGPGYIMIKGLCGQPNILKFLTRELAHKVIEQAEFDFVEGNATGGMVPGWQLCNDISEITGKEIPFCYLRAQRKSGGHDEHISGNRNNPLIEEGMRALVVEELVNFAETTTNAAEIFRKHKYPVSHATCILSYDHSESNRKLKEHKVTLIPLITLPQLLETAETSGKMRAAEIQSYKNYLNDPINWQLDRELVIPKYSAEKAVKLGINMRQLDSDEAIKMGAPEDKVKYGVEYWVKD